MIMTIVLLFVIIGIYACVCKFTYTTDDTDAIINIEQVSKSEGFARFTASLVKEGRVRTITVCLEDQSKTLDYNHTYFHYHYGGITTVYTLFELYNNKQIKQLEIEDVLLTQKLKEFITNYISQKNGKL